MSAPSVNTIAIQGAAAEHRVGEPLSLPINVANNFLLSPELGFSASSSLGYPDPIYARWGNPTVAALERRLAELDGAEDAVCFGSGMAAISALLLGTLSKGDHLVASNICYAGAAELLHETLPRFGIQVSHVDTSDLSTVAAALEKPTRLVFVETPANPILRLTNIRAVAKLASEAGALLAVDSTFATPIATRPMELGANYVIHSLTKYAGGHGDAMGGVVLGRRQQIGDIRSHSLVHLGAVLHPFSAWLIERSLHTLPIRMKRHEANAMKVSAFLQSHPRVEQVFYPGLDSHPQHDLARHQMNNFSGMIAFRAKDGAPLKTKFASEARLLRYAVSLGQSKSLLFYIETQEVQEAAFRLPPAELEKYRACAGDGIYRLSVGLEDPEDLIADLDRVLSAS